MRLENVETLEWVCGGDKGGRESTVRGQRAGEGRLRGVQAEHDWAATYSV